MELVFVAVVTLPVDPLLPLGSPVESSRLNENLFGLRLRFATLSLTYCCKELKKLIFDPLDAFSRLLNDLKRLDFKGRGDFPQVMFLVAINLIGIVRIAMKLHDFPHRGFCVSWNHKKWEKIIYP